MSYAVPVAGTTLLPENLLLLTVETAGTPLAAAYRHAGQFVTLRTPHSPPGYFAMASLPGDSRFQFLIKIELHKPKTAELAKLVAGDTVTVSDVQGTGYPLAAQAGRDLLLVATGTGIAPVRALVDSIGPVRGDFGAITLLYGASTEEALAFPEEHTRWHEAGVNLIACLSRPSADWAGERGYVQELLARLALDPARTSAILSGHKTMTHRAAAVLRGRGVPAERIIENY